MKKTDENFPTKRHSGFTLIELLVVIAIIMMLIGILVPSLGKVKRISKNIQQKSLFHSIELGLEMFLNDFGDYPDSKKISSGTLNYCGAQHLAEVMVGRDGEGYEPTQSKMWNWPGTGPADLYDWNEPASQNRRKKLYVELKDTGAYVPNEIYDSAVVTANSIYSDAGIAAPARRAPVLTDVFLRKKITIAADTIKVGSPVLYFKANRTSRLFKKTGPVVSDDTSKWIYNYYDNAELLKLGSLLDSQQHHYDKDYVDDITGDNGIKEFYQAITNPGVSAVPDGKPFNAKTFMLISAGDDGIFGTRDDVTNFDY